MNREVSEPTAIQNSELKKRMDKAVKDVEYLRKVNDAVQEMLAAWERAEFGSEHPAITGVLVAAEEARKADV